MECLPRASLPMHRLSSSGAGVVTVAVSLLLLAGCATQVRTSGQFAEDAPRDAGFGNLLVVAVTPDLNLRCAFEQSLVNQLRSEAVSATSSCSVTDHDQPLSRELIVQAVADTGADAVIVSSLTGRSSVVAEGATGADSRGGAYYKVTDIGFASTYWGSNLYPAFGIPVAYAELEVADSVFTVQGKAQLATSVFDAADATLVYMMETQAGWLESRSDAIALITPAIAGRLQRDRIIR